jgi:hypothetical protein
VTKVIRISINHKRELYLNGRDSKNPKSKEHYKSYCKLLTKVVQDTKILQHKKQISTSYNKTKTIWDIVKSETGKKETDRRNIIIEYKWQVNPKSTNNCRFF